MIGAPFVPSRAFLVYSRYLPSGRHSGSWWPSSPLSLTFADRIFFVLVSKNWRMTLFSFGSGASVMSAIDFPSGESTGCRIQYDHEYRPFRNLPLASRSGFALPSALTRISDGTSRTNLVATPLTGHSPSPFLLWT